MTNQYHATPYDISATGFYFSTLEEFNEQSVKHKNDYGDPVEEYEIQFIDGDNHKLFAAVGVHQGNLNDWFDNWEDMEGEDLIKALYLFDQGYDASQVLGQLEDVHLFEGTALDWAHEFINDVYAHDFPEMALRYFDYDAFTRDAELEGSITIFNHEGKSYVVTM